MKRLFALLPVIGAVFALSTNAYAVKNYAHIVADIVTPGSVIDACDANSSTWLCGFDGIVACVDSKVDENWRKMREQDCVPAGERINKSKIASEVSRDKSMWSAKQCGLHAGKDTPGDILKNCEYAFKVDIGPGNINEKKIGKTVRKIAKDAGYEYDGQNSWRDEWKKWYTSSGSTDIEPPQPPPPPVTVPVVDPNPKPNPNLCVGKANCNNGCDEDWEFKPDDSNVCYASMKCRDCAGTPIYFWSRAEYGANSPALNKIAGRYGCIVGTIDHDDRPRQPKSLSGNLDNDCSNEKSESIVCYAKRHHYCYDEDVLNPQTNQEQLKTKSCPAGLADCNSFEWWKPAADAKWCQNYDKCFNGIVKEEVPTCKSTDSYQQCLDAYRGIFEKDSRGADSLSSSKADFEFKRDDVVNRAKTVEDAIANLRRTVDAYYENKTGEKDAFSKYYDSCYFARVRDCSDVSAGRIVPKACTAPAKPQACTGFALSTLEKDLAPFANPTGNSIHVSNFVVNSLRSANEQVTRAAALPQTVTIVKGDEDTDMTIGRATGDLYNALKAMVQPGLTSQQPAIETICGNLPASAHNTGLITGDNCGNVRAATGAAGADIVFVAPPGSSPSRAIASRDSKGALELSKRSCGGEKQDDNQLQHDYQYLKKLAGVGNDYCCSFNDRYCMSQTPVPVNPPPVTPPDHGAGGKGKNKHRAQ